jgi:hypothetical protein
MAKRLGFLPDALIRARRGPKHKWKLPVNEWVRELYRKRFGHVLGQKPLPAPVPVEVELDQEAMRRFEEQLYWEDYWARNEDDTAQRSAKAARRSRRSHLAPAPHHVSTKALSMTPFQFLGELAPNRLAGRRQVRRAAPSFDAATSGLCTSES